MGSRISSYANISGSYGSMDASSSFSSVGGGPSASPLDAAPSPLHSREFSEGTMFGNTFDEDLELMQPGFTLALGMAVFTAVLGKKKNRRLTVRLREA